MRKSIKMTFFLLAILLSTTLVSCGKSDKNPGSNSKSNNGEVSMKTVKHRKIENYLEENGEIMPESKIKVKFNFSGKLIRLYKEEGDMCTPGERMALVSPDINQIRSFTSAQISLQKTKTSLSKLNNELQEAKELYSQGLISRQNYDNTFNDQRIAEAEVVKARLELQALQESGSLKGSKAISVKSPIRGTVIKRYVDVGDYVLAASAYQSGTVLFEIADITKLIIEAKINEMDILNVNQGANVNLVIEALPHKSFTGRVFRIFPMPVSVDNVKKYVVQISTPSDFPKTIKPGMSVRIKILTVQRNDVLSVAIGSVVRDPDKKMDYVLVQQGNMFKKLYIKTGVRDYDNIEILDGLKKGDKVVKRPYKIDLEQIIEDEEIEGKEKAEKPKSKTKNGDGKNKPRKKPKD